MDFIRFHRFLYNFMDARIRHLGIVMRAPGGSVMPWPVGHRHAGWSAFPIRFRKVFFIRCLFQAIGIEVCL